MYCMDVKLVANLFWIMLVTSLRTICGIMTISEYDFFHQFK